MNKKSNKILTIICALIVFISTCTYLQNKKIENQVYKSDLTEVLISSLLPVNEGLPLNNSEGDSDLKILQKRITKMTRSLTDLWCLFRNNTYYGSDCLSDTTVYKGYNREWDLGLCKGLDDLIGNKSVGNLEAGLGLYGRCLLRRKEPVFTLKRGRLTREVNNDFLLKMENYINETQKIFSWEGFDDAGAVEKLSNGFIVQRELVESGLWLGRKYDWVISLGIGEHIPAMYEKIYMNNLVRHSCQGIVLAWPINNVDVNGLSHYDVVDFMKSKYNDKLQFDNEGQELLRNRSTYMWYRKSILVFRFINPTDCTLPVS